VKVISSPIADVFVLEPIIFEDPRGFFLESFNEHTFNQATGLSVRFVQDNHSYSVGGVLRGLHYQVNQPQAKLVSVIRGTIFDVAVDLRRDSPTFGKWFGCELSALNRHQRWIPSGFAHGFLVTSDCADVIYKTTCYYSPENERCIRWDDPTLAISWPICGEPLLAVKDRFGSAWPTVETF
jgi:dTDP-4-dehydrorhamnose 3,5-epimerase